MNSAKKLKTKRSLSAKDLVVQKYRRNREKIKELTIENNGIKEDWLHGGSFSTHNFIVVIKKSRYLKAPNKFELFEALGMSAEKLLVSKTRIDIEVEEK